MTTSEICGGGVRMKSWMVLSILLVLYGGISCAQAKTSKSKSPTAKFYERMQYIPFIWYQCYRNGSFLETSNTIITSGLWDGTSGNNECAGNTIWEIFNGTARSSTMTTFSTCYDPESEVGYLTINETLHESFTILQEPYKGMAYFVAYETGARGIGREPYNPQGCFKCQRFVHGSWNCRGSDTYAKCSNNEDVADVCENEAQCANCYGKLGQGKVYKIYDRVETCVHADELLPMLCPDGCGMISTKLNLSP